jgi:hypothetical protein
MTFLVVIASSGFAYGVSPSVLRNWLPTQLDRNLYALRTEVDRTKTKNGAKVTLKWAYADERFVAVGLRTQPAKYAPSLFDDTVGNEAKFPPYVQITDTSGQDFDTVGGGTWLPPHRTGAEAVFDAPEGLEPGRKHRFRLEVPLGTQRKLVAKPGPFVFKFKIPVRPVPTIEVNQTGKKKGIPVTLERVVDSPVLPQAVVCFEPPDDKYHWMPWLKDDGSYGKVTTAPYKLGKGCWSLPMGREVEGRTSVTVAYLEGMSRSLTPKRIRGPWTFEFKAPDDP